MKRSIFNINIYRPEGRGKKAWKPPSPDVFQGVIAIISILLLFTMCGFIFFGLYLPQKRSLGEARSQAEDLEFKLQGTKTLAQALVSTRDLYLQLNAEAVGWTEKLSVLSKSIPENIWFSSIEFSGRAGKVQEGPNLVILGSTFSGLGEENIDQIGDLLIRLNNAEEFKEDFEPLRLEYSKKTDAEWGIITFRLIGKSRNLSL
jgi:hypothetical protein